MDVYGYTEMEACAMNSAEPFEWDRYARCGQRLGLGAADGVGLEMVGDVRKEISNSFELVVDEPPALEFVRLKKEEIERTKDLENVLHRGGFKLPF